MTGEIVTRTWSFHIGEDGILRATVLPGAEDKLADAMETVRVVTTLLAGRPRPTLCDARLLKSMDREARAYYGQPEHARLVSAVALLVGSPATRVIGNFFLVVNKPLAPTRLFSSEAEALAWLKGFLA